MNLNPSVEQISSISKNKINDPTIHYISSDTESKSESESLIELTDISKSSEEDFQLNKFTKEKDLCIIDEHKLTNELEM